VASIAQVSGTLAYRLTLFTGTLVAEGEVKNAGCSVDLRFVTWRPHLQMAVGRITSHGSEKRFLVASAWERTDLPGIH
jgi:hypothetical protein